METIEILLNGEPHRQRAGGTLDDLVEDLGLRPQQVAIELNRDLVPRGRRAEVRLTEGDRVELVTLVGGG